MVAEKEGVSPPKLRPQQLQEPLRHARRTKKQVSDGFTIKAMMKNTVVKGPPAAGAFKERPTKPTAFRKFYERGDFPIALEHDTRGNKIAWKVIPTYSTTADVIHSSDPKGKSYPTGCTAQRYKV